MPKQDKARAADRTKRLLDEGGEEGSDRPRLDGQLQAHIGRQLRMFYEGVINEPIPDRFLKLLDELERSPQRRDEDGAPEPAGDGR